jgi:hypothetical protein
MQQSPDLGVNCRMNSWVKLVERIDKDQLVDVGIAENAVLKFDIGKFQRWREPSIRRWLKEYGHYT